MQPRAVKLERILQSQGFGSRKACRLLIAAGQVCIAGVPIRNVDAELPVGKLADSPLDFTVGGETWRYRERVYLALNKPPGFECSREPQQHRSVMSLLPAPLVQRGVQPVGRLDQDTSGLLLLSDDGQFIHALASPKRHVAKTYQAITKHVITDELLARLRDGVLLRDETEALAAQNVHRLAPNLLSLSINQGKYHQVKRMVAAAGNRVEALQRIAMGSLSLGQAPLPPLKEGEWCYLDSAALALLGYSAAGSST